MSFKKNVNIILDELNETLNCIDEESCANAITLIDEAKKIFALGLGRAGFMEKSFAMRLMHMGKDAYVVGETINPNFDKGDLLIVGSGSGETKELLQKAQKAKDFGGKVLLFTTAPESSIAKISDAVISINASSKAEVKQSSVQPMASLYEQSILLAADALVLTMMDASDKPNSEMFKKHSNLE